MTINSSSHGRPEPRPKSAEGAKILGKLVGKARMAVKSSPSGLLKAFEKVGRMAKNRPGRPKWR